MSSGLHCADYVELEGLGSRRFSRRSAFFADVQILEFFDARDVAAKGHPDAGGFGDPRIGRFRIAQSQRNPSAFK